jgi:hypothetical protein
MHEKINDEIIYKACQLCPNDNNTAIDQLLSGQIFTLIEQQEKAEAA